MKTTMRRLAAWLLDTGPVLVLAGLAAAGSFTHIRDTATAHGQHGWQGVAAAVCIDLVCVMAARERQRDARLHRRHRGLVSWPTLVLASGIVLSLAANLAQAQPSVWGWIVAGVPAAAFLTAVSMLERRAGDPRTVRTAPHDDPAHEPVPSAQSADQSTLYDLPAPAVRTAPVPAQSPGLAGPQGGADRAEWPVPADIRARQGGETGTPPMTPGLGGEQAPWPVPADRSQRPVTAEIPQHTDEVAARRQSRHEAGNPAAAQARVVLDEVTETITYPAPAPGQGPAPAPHKPPAREELVAELADQIRADPHGWRPDYGDLMARSDMGRRWCEYVVRDARTAAAPPRTPARTGPAHDHTKTITKEEM